MLLTNNLVVPVMMALECCFVSGSRLRKASRVEGEFMGRKIAAGRSCKVKTGERIEYGGNWSWRAMALVTAKEAVGAQRPR